jgi:hypothetical protein
MWPDNKENRRTQIPIRIEKDGNIRFLYGGNLPELRPGTIGDLIVSRESVIDDEFLVYLERDEIKEIYPQCLPLMAQINPKNLQILDLFKQPSSTPLVHVLETGSQSKSHSVAIELEQPLCLRLHGTKKAELQDCRCKIPALPDLGRDIVSINQAYTIISENFEPNRRSHSGNVFEKVFFKETGLKYWQPLRKLRDRIEKEFEDELISLVQSRRSQWWFQDEKKERNRSWAFVEKRRESNFAVYCFNTSSQIYAEYFFNDVELAEEWLRKNIYKGYIPGQNTQETSPPIPPFKKANGEEVRFCNGP